jgi:hypothetical protein
VGLSYIRGHDSCGILKGINIGESFNRPFSFFFLFEKIVSSPHVILKDLSSSNSGSPIVVHDVIGKFWSVRIGCEDILFLTFFFTERISFWTLRLRSERTECRK